MALAKEHKLQREIDREELAAAAAAALHKRAIAAGFTDLYGDDGMGMGLRGTINGKVEWVKEYLIASRDSEINRAMAEVAGWDFDPPQAREWDSRGKWVTGPSGTPSLIFAHNIPNYLTDLDAVHEVVRKLTDDEYANYSKYLSRMFGLTRPRHHDATARQRCEAILKNMNRWNPEWDL